MMSLVLVCLARDREINLICSVSRQTPGRVDYNLLKSAGPPCCLSLLTHVVEPGRGAKIRGNSFWVGGGGCWTAAMEHERDGRYLLLHVPERAVDTELGIFSNSSAVKYSSKPPVLFQIRVEIPTLFPLSHQMMASRILSETDY